MPQTTSINPGEIARKINESPAIKNRGFYEPERPLFKEWLQII
jgi:hypothetical protein